MIGTLELVSISDFVLSALCLFLAGVLFGNLKSHYSQYGALAYFLLFSGLSAFMAGVDHGFFEPVGERYVARTLTYLCIAGGTFFLFRLTILSFFTGPVKRILLYVALIQLIGFAIAAFKYHDYLLVVANYVPILLLFFVMSIIYLRRGKTEFYFFMFCTTSVLATIVQVMDIGILRLNGDTLYHIIGMGAYILLFAGGKNIRDSRLST